MKLYGVGNALLYYREKENITQEQLCEGICPIATLCRIETGEREFDSLISDTLLSRLGKTANRFEFVLNEEDYVLYDTREKIENSIKNRNVEEVEHLIEKYEKLMPQNQILHQQFITFYKAMVLKEKGKKEEVINMLHEAINMTKPDYKENSDNLKLYSVIEIKIIYELFQYEKYEEENLNSLFQYMNRFFDEEEKASSFVPFMYQLVLQHEEKEKYMEAIKIAEKAIDTLCNGKSYLYIADLYFEKLKCEEKLYNGTKQWKNRMKENYEMCNDIFYMYMVEENLDKMNQIDKFCEEKLGCQIIKPEIL